jgi:hypothetical protein
MKLTKLVLISFIAHQKVSARYYSSESRENYIYHQSESHENYYNFPRVIPYDSDERPRGFQETGNVLTDLLAIPFDIINDAANFLSAFGVSTRDLLNFDRWNIFS